MQVYNGCMTGERIDESMVTTTMTVDRDEAKIIIDATPSFFRERLMGYAGAAVEEAGYYHIFLDDYKSWTTWDTGMSVHESNVFQLATEAGVDEIRLTGVCNGV